MAHPTRLLRDEESYTRYVARPATSDSRDEVKGTSYWEHVMAQLKAGDVVEVYPEDRSYFLEMLLIGKRDGSLAWRILHEVEFGAAPATVVGDDPNDGLEVTWGGPKHLHRVVDNKTTDNKVIAFGFSTKEEAEAELEKIRESRRG